MVNENRPAFSLIVPVYNGQAVIRRCIESVLQQQYSVYEMIIVDDGSSDNTGTICKQYAGSDERIKYYRQDNGGVSAARNKGLTLAKNDYILFVDADDYLLPGYIQEFYERIQRNKMDDKTFVLQDYVTNVLYADGRTEIFKWCNLEYKQYSLKEAFESLTDRNWFLWGMPFSKLYRLSIIKAKSITFKKDIQGREDLVFMLEYMQYMDTVIFDPVANYHYIIDKTKESVSSVMTSFKNESTFFQSMKQLTDDYSNRFHLSKEVQLTMSRFVYTSFSRCINSCLYEYKVPTNRATRVQNIGSLATKENLQRFIASGAADSKVKRLSVILLKMRLFLFFDLLNVLRHRFS